VNLHSNTTCTTTMGVRNTMEATFDFPTGTAQKMQVIPLS